MFECTCKIDPDFALAFGCDLHGIVISPHFEAKSREERRQYLEDMGIDPHRWAMVRELGAIIRPLPRPGNGSWD